mmetsp:Transcript_12680/g.33664  ORF Transcript_12680/g.33664 Transcript_12680/m.33664 type:complete len:351 (+) Transcript_12680:249-1301(+)
MLLVRLRQLHLLLLQGLRRRLDLSLLGGLELLESLGVAQRVLLRLGEVRLECFLHLLQDPEHLARSRHIRLLEGGLLAVVARARAWLLPAAHLGEGHDQPALLGRDGIQEQHLVPLHHRARQLEGLGDLPVVDQRGAGVVLGQHGDGRVQGPDVLKHQLLLGVELRGLLLSNGSLLVQRLLALSKVLLVALDLGPEAGAPGRRFLDHRLQLRDAGLGVGHRLGLLLVVCFAPTRHLVVDLFVFVRLLLQLLLHVLQQSHDLRDRVNLDLLGPQHDAPVALAGQAGVAPAQRGGQYGHEHRHGPARGGRCPGELHSELPSGSERMRPHAGSDLQRSRGRAGLGPRAAPAAS